jgi:mono/diheme cytochrome c family protein
MKIKFKLVGGFAVLAATLVLSSCVSDPDSAGLEYMPDMYRSAAIEPYVDYGQIKERMNPELKVKLSAKTPPFGTIPYVGTDSNNVSIMMPYDRLPNEAFKKTHGLFGAAYSNEDVYAAASVDKNPMKITADNFDAVMESGKTLYATYCLHCHGEKGDGNGPMVESGAYAGVANYANVKDLSDGQLFYSIYYGKGAMGAHNSLVNKKEIWTLVHYIRKFQDANYGPGAAVAVPADTIQ